VGGSFPSPVLGKVIPVCKKEEDENLSVEKKRMKT
jgi:hypothetical protein